MVRNGFYFKNQLIEKEDIKQQNNHQRQKILKSIKQISQRINQSFIINQSSRSQYSSKQNFSNRMSERASYMTQIALLQQKVVHLQADNIIFSQEVGRLRRRVIQLQQYRIKYQLLVQKQTDQSPLARSRRADQINNMSRKIQENNQKWITKITTLQDKYIKTINQLQQQLNELNKKLQLLENEKINNTNNTTKLPINRKNSKQQQQQQTKLAQQIKQLRVKNLQLNTQNTQQKQLNTQLQQQLQQMNTNLQKLNQQQLQTQQKITQAKQQQKQFYRNTIIQMQQKITQLQSQIEYHKVRSSPERQFQINKLEEHIKLIENNHLLEISKFTQLIKQKDRHVYDVEELIKLTKKQSHQIILQLQDKLKQSQQENFNLKQQEHFQIIACREELQKIHQQQVNQLKQSFTTLQASFDKQRQQWQLILQSQSQQLQRIKSQWQEDKEKYMQEKTKLKRKIEELKSRIKSTQQDEKQKVQQQTKQLLENIKLVDQEENKFTDYENGIVFLHRQLKKSMAKVEEKQRQIAQLLNELKTQRNQFQQEVEFIKKTQRSQVAYYKQKLLQTDQQNAKLLSEIRDKQKYIRAKDDEHKGIYEKLAQQNESLRNMVEQMERDYRRLTENRKELYQQYRSERDLVFTGKSELNQQRKNKYLHLARQKNQLQIAYKEREKQLRNQYELQINTLNQQLYKINMEKQSTVTQLQILKEKNQNDQNIPENKKANKQKNLKDFHKKLASLDLQINLTQNLYATINSLKVRKNKKNQLDEMSMNTSEKSMTEKEQNIHEMREMSLNSEQQEQVNISPTFSLNPNMRSDQMQNFSFYPQDLTVKVSKPQQKRKNHTEVSFDPSRNMFEYQQQQ